MDWKSLTSEEQLQTLIEETTSPNSGGIMLFKHSTRCSISFFAKKNLEQEWDENSAIQTYLLDLLNFRNVSNAIERLFHIKHESPQVLVVKNGECIYNASHHQISAQDILSATS